MDGGSREHDNNLDTGATMTLGTSGKRARDETVAGHNVSRLCLCVVCVPMAVHVCEEVKIMWTYYVYLSAQICVLCSYVPRVLCVFPPTHARVAFTGVNRFLAERYVLKRVYVYMYIHTHTHRTHTCIHSRLGNLSACGHGISNI